jgi:FkbM family methyltransferase
MNKEIHRAVTKLGMEEFFVGLRRRANLLRRFIPKSVRHKFGSVGKFVPHSTSYPKDDRYFLTRDNTSFKINRSDYVQWRIFYGVRDNALKFAKQCLASDSVILDIGANCGAFSLKLATYAARHDLSNLQIHAFEPNPIIVKNYKDNLSLNPTALKFIHIHPIGFGKDAGEKSFHYPEANTGVGRVVQENTREQFKVNIQRLDDFISKLNPPKISFIKLIVEGFEPEVFKGGWNTLKRYKPPIFFEVTEEWYRENNSSVAEVLEALRELGYQFMGEYYNEMIPYDEAKFGSVHQFNLLATVNA